jgi:hypothetical protein
VLSKAAFEANFPSLPPLPVKDFRAGQISLTFGSFGAEPFVYRPGEAWVVPERARSWSRADRL